MIVLNIAVIIAVCSHASYLVIFKSKYCTQMSSSSIILDATPMHPSFKWVLSKTPLPHYISIQTVPTNFLQQLEFILTQKSEGIGKVAEILQLSLVGSLVSLNLRQKCCTFILQKT